jgi:glycerophosphoryl diester phosphodiesterase
MNLTFQGSSLKVIIMKNITAPAFFDAHPRILAHRGDSEFFPENTLPAFMSAKELKVDVIETDVHITADNEVVIWHDDTLDRETNGTGPVEQYTLKELLKFDAGFNFTRDGGKTYPFRGTGITLLPLDEALTALPRMRFNIDLKSNDLRLPEKFAEIIHRHNAEERIIGASFHTAMLRRLRILLPETATSFAIEEVKPLLIRYKLGLPPRRKQLVGQVLQVPERYEKTAIVSRRFIRKMHAAGLYIHVWTINNPDDMRRLINMGVDGIFTDNPRLLAKVYAEEDLSKQ